ncbi:MAG: ribosome recycling factor [Candidatus Marinimicrobia bacterium]|jgi:ribosome recycling factor|nr:ribosome recycling factor [Candidatus Neomarinimicrobiota bacterium]
MLESLYKECKAKMDKSVEVIRHELASIRTGRASTALLDGIKVEYYGNPTPLNQVANITVPEARLLVIQPWEKNMLPVIEKAILASSLGLTPANDGQVIRLPIPPMSEERRKDLSRVVNKIAEEGRISIRNVRREFNDHIKKMEKDSEISKDNAADALDEIQKITDEHIAKIDEIFELKEKEILEDRF